jgi:DNA ligase-1
MFKPMLASPVELDKVGYPVLVSPKLDGIRAIVKDGIVLSRSLKPIPNKYVQRLFASRFENCDGELIVGSPTSDACYRDSLSGVMTEEGEPDVKFWMFDHIEFPDEPYVYRRDRLKHTRFSPVLEQVLVTNESEVLYYEEQCLTMGYEGLILRDPEAKYKYGRSTAREGYLLKLKRFVDAEAEVIGFEERMHNGNEATISELGRTKRSSHKANKSGRGDLGALVCQLPSGVEFNIGTGFTDDERAAIWKDRDSFIGRLAKFKSFPIGSKDAPRHPVFLGWRDDRDT